MNNARMIAVITMVAVTSFAMVMVSAVDSFAQNDTTTIGNQSALNETAMENATGTGSISAFTDRGP